MAFMNLGKICVGPPCLITLSEGLFLLTNKKKCLHPLHHLFLIFQLKYAKASIDYRSYFFRLEKLKLTGKAQTLCFQVA